MSRIMQLTRRGISAERLAHQQGFTIVGAAALSTTAALSTYYVISTEPTLKPVEKAKHAAWAMPLATVFGAAFGFHTIMWGVIAYGATCGGVIYTHAVCKKYRK